MFKRFKRFLRGGPRFSLRRAIFGFFLTLIFLGLVLDFYLILFADRFILNLKIAEVSLGGLSFAQAKEKLASVIEKKEKEPVMLKFNFAGTEKNFEIAPYEIDYQVDLEKSLKEAFAYGHRETTFASLIEAASILFSGKNFPVVFSVNSEKLNAKITEIANEIDLPEKNASLLFLEKEVKVVPSEKGYRLNQPKIKETILSQLAFLKREPILLKREPVLPKLTSIDEKTLTAAKNLVSKDLWIKIDERRFKFSKKEISKLINIEADSNIKIKLKEEELYAFVEKLAKEVEVAPENARLQIKEGVVTVIKEGSLGKVLDRKAAVSLIKAALMQRLNNFNEAQDEIVLSLQTINPEVSSQTVKNLNIKDLLGKATTSFAGSPENRVYNIKLGVSFLNGLLVPPGQEFSTLKALGRIDAASGFLPELVIKENKTIPEFGGGLCQVSTTLFRAALNAGLPITERANHRYRVSYYEANVGPGLDATIYEPKPDLKFKNDTAGHLLIQGYVEGKNLTFEIYGINDGRTVKIEGPTILSTTPAPSPEYIDTDTLPKGQLKQIERAHDGATTIATYTVFRDGKEINKQVFKSTYVPWRARYLRGTAEPAATPAPPAQ
jgi:vancomycin resistance protein YoaR